MGQKKIEVNTKKGGKADMNHIDTKLNFNNDDTGLDQVAEVLKKLDETIGTVKDLAEQLRHMGVKVEIDVKDIWKSR